MSCTWTLEGELSKATFKTTANGKSYWIALVRVDAGEVCLYVHDAVLQRSLEVAALGCRVRAVGVIEPHNRYSQAEKPYFLSPNSLVFEPRAS